jgi:S1-C subfamily serine protease
MLPLLLLTGAAWPAPLTSLPLPPGVAWVRVENDSAGTGFVVDAERKLLVTCRHLVADRKKVDVFFPWVGPDGWVTERATYLRNRQHLRGRGLLVTGTVLKTSDDLDLALVGLESLPPDVRAVPLAPHAPRPGEPLRLVGNRVDLDTLWNLTTGPVRAVGRLRDGYFWRGKKLAVDAEVFIAQLPTEEGDSGGPVFDSGGRLVGMATALRRQCPLAAVCVAVSEVRAFVGLPGPGDPRADPQDSVAEKLLRATVWVRPTATGSRLAGVLIAPDRVLTVGDGLVPGDRVGVALPIRRGREWVTELAAYRDPLALSLGGDWCGATVLAHDPDRHLVLLRLDRRLGGNLRPLPFSPVPSRPGEAIHTLNHPGGLEFAWVYAGGTVRQTGRIALEPGKEARPLEVIVCQLPAQAGSPGGAVVNDRGELVGIVWPRESAQLVGYALTAAEVAHFLDAADLTRPPRTLAGLLARFGSWPAAVARAVARGLGERAHRHLAAGRSEDAYADCRAALALDPGCVPARTARVRLLRAADRPEVALQELDAAVEKGPFDRGVLLGRSELAAAAKDWRKARGDLERLLDVDPADADARQRLVPVLLALGEDARAADAVRDTLRADPQRVGAVAADLLAQAERLEEKYPAAPSVAADWLVRALTAARRPEFATALRAAAAEKDEARRLAVLRAALQAVVGK